ncbi:toxin-antitoxin system YwqK family antitoxin [Akkermansiaceae bacterium]|nr:toxin-antitoxin system YwqK family antitoxin [Akkermansiaceae bacterium]
MKHLLLMAFAVLTIGCGEKKSEDVNHDELEVREGVAYLKNSDSPYTGKVFEFHDNGQKKSEGNYKDGKQDGHDVTWYDNGQKRSEGNYKDGKLHGDVRGWHENGQKMENATYKKGKPDGRSLAWHENGQMKSETNWKNGQIDGTLTLWHKNGKKMLQGAVKGGKHISNQFWNSKGEEVDSREEAGLNGPLFEALGGVGFAYYTMKMNEDSFKAIAIPVEGLPTELCEDWEAAFQEVLSNEAILQEIADETQYAEKLGVPSEEAVSHLKEAIKVRFVKRNNWIEIGLVGKRKQNEDLMKIAELLHERGAENVVKKTPSFQQYLDELNKQKEKGQ